MARQRALVWVTGPPGVGKTTLVELLLGSNRSWLLLAARLRAEPGLRTPFRERRADPDATRYMRAGAIGSAACLYRPGHTEEAADAFWDTDLMSEYSQGVLLEANGRPWFGDLTVFVARPLPAGRPLVARRRVAAHREMERLLARLGALGLAVGPGVRRQVRAARAAGTKLRAERWALRASHAALSAADVVVVNIRGERERPAAERTAAEMLRPWTDEDVGRDLGMPTRRRPLVLIANLADRRDAGLRKVLARIKATVDRVAGPGSD